MRTIYIALQAASGMESSRALIREWLTVDRDRAYVCPENHRTPCINPGMSSISTRRIFSCNIFKERPPATDAPRRHFTSRIEGRGGIYCIPLASIRLWSVQQGGAGPSGVRVRGG